MGLVAVLTLRRLRRVLCTISMQFSFKVVASEYLHQQHSPSGNVMVILKTPPSHIVLSLPGMPHSHVLRSMTPFLPLTGRAQKPKGWSRLHCFLNSITELVGSPQSWGSAGHSRYGNRIERTSPLRVACCRAPWLVVLWLREYAKEV